MSDKINVTTTGPFSLYDYSADVVIQKGVVTEVERTDFVQHHLNLKQLTVVVETAPAPVSKPKDDKKDDKKDGEKPPVVSK